MSELFEQNVMTYQDELREFLFRLANVDLRAFAFDVLTKEYPIQDTKTLGKRLRNLDLCRYAIRYLKDRGMYNEYHANQQVDALLLGLLLHDLLFCKEKDKWTSVFQARCELSSVAEKYLTKENAGVIEYVWTIIEAQLGEEMPIPACRPVTGQIASIAYEILWFFEHPFGSAEVSKQMEEDEKLFHENVYPLLNKS